MTQKLLLVVVQSILFTFPLAVHATPLVPRIRLVTRWLSVGLAQVRSMHSAHSFNEQSFFQEGMSLGKKWTYRFERLHHERMVRNESFDSFANKMVRHAIQLENPLADLDTIRKDYSRDILYRNSWQRWSGFQPTSLGDHITIMKGSFTQPVSQNGNPESAEQLADFAWRVKEHLPYRYADALYTLLTNDFSNFEPCVPIFDPATLEHDLQRWFSGRYNENETLISLQNAALRSIPSTYLVLSKKKQRFVAVDIIARLLRSSFKTRTDNYRDVRHKEKAQEEPTPLIKP